MERIVITTLILSSVLLLLTTSLIICGIGRIGRSSIVSTSRLSVKHYT